jgi:TatD DNase family protein
LAPVPYRGKPNEPAYVVDVALRLAAELGWELARIAQQTTANVREIFAIEVPAVNAS